MNNDLREALIYALEKYPERVEVVPVSELVIETARQNEKRPAYVKLAVPDALVKQLRGQREGGDLNLVVHVPQEVIKRSESRIILPGEL